MMGTASTLLRLHISIASYGAGLEPVPKSQVPQSLPFELSPRVSTIIEYLFVPNEVL